MYAKINPSAEAVKQLTPFEYETTTADYMTAVANPYALGTNSVNFIVNFGFMTFDAQNYPIEFTFVTTTSVNLSGSQLSNWGADDSVIMQELATQLGCTILQIINF